MSSRLRVRVAVAAFLCGGCHGGPGSAESGVLTAPAMPCCEGESSTGDAESTSSTAPPHGSEGTSEDTTNGEGSDDGGSDDAGGESTGTETPAPPLSFNIVVRQTVQACASCGIWFDWQGVEEDKPWLEVTWQTAGLHTTAFGDQAQSFFISPSPPSDPMTRRHALLVKQAPLNHGLFRADLSAIPVEATIVEATLHLHLHEEEGLAYSDFESVLEVWECSQPWDWDGVDWNQAAPGLPWATPGGDMTRHVRDIRANEDMHALGYNKANPNVPFDVTEYVALLQAER